VTRAQIIGTGSYAPEKVMTNDDLAKIVETSDEWIFERTGIRQRHVAAEGEVTSDMALKASVRALEMANTRAEELDVIIVGTIYIQTGAIKRALVVGVELLTRIIDWEDRNSCVLFGDAAGAMVLGPSEDPNRGILSTHLHTDGSQTDILCIKGGGSKHPASEEMLKQKLHKVSMNGREVYKFAVRSLTDAVKEGLAFNNLPAEQVTHVIAHQANIRIIDAVPRCPPRSTRRTAPASSSPTTRSP
jgi:3-oxoacyl-[acyl-carrier-protein] synthase-3